MKKNCALSGGSCLVTDDRESVRGADFIYTDVWYGLYENEMPKEERVRVFHDYQVNRELMQLGNLGCKFMHCLPATRGEDVTDEVATATLPLLGGGRQPPDGHARTSRLLHALPAGAERFSDRGGEGGA